MEYKEFEKMMKSARNAFIKANEKMREVLNRIGEELDGEDLTDYKTYAENADNFEEAVLCFLQYGEYSIRELWDELGEHLGANRGTE